MPQAYKHPIPIKHDKDVTEYFLTPPLAPQIVKWSSFKIDLPDWVVGSRGFASITAKTSTNAQHTIVTFILSMITE